MKFEKIRNWQKKKEEPSSSQRIRDWLSREPVRAQCLAHLLALLAGRPCFCLMIVLAIGLTIGLAIDGAELIGEKIAVSFSK